MVADIIEVLTDAMVGLVSALSTTLLDAFDALIYNSTTGLTSFAA